MIVLGCDHAGFLLKERLKKWLLKKDIRFVDVGAENIDLQDSYVLYAKNAVEYFVNSCDKNTDKLILICGSGVGMNIVANRNSDIRAVLALSKKQAIQAREHNDANCLCLGARNTNLFGAKRIVKAFLNTNFLQGKYLDRIKSI